MSRKLTVSSIIIAVAALALVGSALADKGPVYPEGKAPIYLQPGSMYQPNAPFCFGKSPTVIGTPGDDELVGRGNDVIVGLGGDDRILGTGDTICGNGGDDEITSNGGASLSGGDGRDNFYVGSADPRFPAYGGAGDDRYIGRRDAYGDDRFYGGPGNDYIWGSRGDDLLVGEEGDDLILDTVDGRDTLVGGPGDDYIEAAEAEKYDPARDFVVGGAGTDNCLFNSEDVAKECP